MSCPVRVIPASSPEWGDWIARAANDFPHTAAYHGFSEGCGEGEALLAVCGEPDRFLAWPYLLRSVDDVPGLTGSGYRDITSVYGYPGPLACGCAPGDPFLCQAWQALAGVWREQKAVSAFTRFNPLLENRRWVFSGDSADALGVRANGRTVSIDLTQTEADVWKNYKRQLRQHLLRGRAEGLVSEVDESWTHLEDFVRIYTCTMSRNSADRRYFFTRDYFDRLRRALGPAAILFITRAGEQVAAAGFVVEYGGVVNPHLAGSDNALLYLSPFKVFMDDLRRWGQQRGNHTLHMGGGRGGAGDSLFRFKAEFSPRWHEFHTGRWILDLAAYEELCESRLNHAESVGLETGLPDFFPAYRAPMCPRQDNEITARSLGL